MCVTAYSLPRLCLQVKECGRLIVRMGTELMEETKRRQLLEAEVQELRMRLVGGIEALSRSPLVGNCGASDSLPGVAAQQSVAHHLFHETSVL